MIYEIFYKSLMAFSGWFGAVRLYVALRPFHTRHDMMQYNTVKKKEDENNVIKLDSYTRRNMT